MDNFGMCGLLINGVPLDTYEGAALLDYSVGETSIKNETFQGINRSTWHLLKSIYGLRKITLTIVFTGPTRRAVTLQRSKLNGALFGASELYISDDGFFYDVTVESCGPEILVGEGEREVKIKSEYTFTGTRRDALVSETIPGGGKIFCKSTMPFTDARLKTTVGGTQPRTFSGPVVTFEKIPTNVLTGLSAAINPIQNFNGYENPWPAGGGKNLFDSSLLTDAGWTEATGVYTGSSADIKQSAIPNFLKASVPAGQRITFSLDVLNDNVDRAGYFWILYDDATKDFVECPANASTWTHKTKTSASGKNVSEIYFWMSNSVNFSLKNIQIEYGTSETSFAPYSNICPISGWTECKVTRAGKNLATVSSGNNIIVGKVKRGVSYTFSVHNIATVGFSLRKESQNGAVVVATSGASTEQVVSLTFTADEDFNLFLNGYGGGGGTFVDNASMYQLEVGSTATSYEPYQGQTYTIDLDGTRYGGTLDVLAGKLTVTDGYIASYNGETLPSTWISDRDVYAAGTTPTTGAEVVYKLASPFEIDLTETEVELLTGTNNIWSDTGDVTVTIGNEIPTPYPLGGAIFPSVSNGDVLVFDGIDGKITKNGANAAASVNWTEFPQLFPGENTITCPDDVTVEYYPTYI